MKDRKNVYLGGEDDNLEKVNPRHIEKFLSWKLMLIIFAMMVAIMWLVKR